MRMRLEKEDRLAQLKANGGTPECEEAVVDALRYLQGAQHRNGRWEYAYEEDTPRGGDLSNTSWQMQALKAGQSTELEFRNYRCCVHGALDFVQHCQAVDGTFSYTYNGKGKIALTGAGALCIQQHRNAADPLVQKAITQLSEHSQFNFKDGPCNLYEHYYSSLAMRNAGGEAWTTYNALFRDELLMAQKKDGSWSQPGGKNVADNYKSASYNTALSALILEYY